MKTRVLILGSTGMLGHVVQRYLSQQKGFEAAGTVLEPASDPMHFNAEGGLDRLGEICRQGGFEYLINCIGITAVRMKPEQPASIARALRINALFPQTLSVFAVERGLRVLHISTDGVFSGQAELYDEGSPADCLDLYGKSKSLGEAHSSGFINIRCSIIGPSPYEQGGLYEWMKSQAEGAVLSGYTDHIWHGVSTLQFATLCERIIRGKLFDSLRELSHVFHFAPNQPVSKYELLCILARVLNKRVEIKPAAAPGGPCKRILVTRYEQFRNLFPEQPVPMEQVLLEVQNHISAYEAR